MKADIKIYPGKPVPLGTVVVDSGVQFSVFSRHGNSVGLLFFDSDEDKNPGKEIILDPEKNRTGDIWHVFIYGAEPGDLYMYTVDGPLEPEAGHRFDKSIFLLDPYAKAVTEFGKGVVVDDSFDWMEDRPLNYPLRHSIIYETHVRGLTIDPSSRVSCPGTYRGVIEKIPYFLELGISSLEFLPVMEFNENENTHRNPVTGEKLKNYWGYSTIAFFAPKGGYSSSGSNGGQVSEFKEMVRELHKAGIEIILDVVFNHTAEMDENGPTYNFRGYDNSIYYILDEDRRFYKDFTGCRNTLNCNHPIVRSFILDCLHYWVVEMHVDGFRFDLGSVLGRDSAGNLLENPPVLEKIAEDPVLRNTKIIAEAWDAAGAYQVGSFPGGRWAEWNDKYRDDIRKFWRGDIHYNGPAATRITGSSDLYLRDGRKPFHSINLITSHDGFTLNDLVSYKSKHNLINGEDRRDGTNSNYSCNFGHEGSTEDPEVNRTRNRYIKNYLAMLFLSIGTPMILGGDEFRRSQRGNNNAYCQDNEISWYNWGLAETHSDILRFTRMLIAFRQSHPAFHRPEFYTGTDSNHNMIPDISWFSPDGTPMNWELKENSLAFLIDGSKAEIEADRDDNDFYVILCGQKEQQKYILPKPINGKKWFLIINTACDSPSDSIEPGKEEVLSNENAITAEPGSVIVLLAK